MDNFGLLIVDFVTANANPILKGYYCAEWQLWFGLEKDMDLVVPNDLDCGLGIISRIASVVN